MKKIIISGILLIILGYYLGYFIFNEKIINKYKKEEKYYFLQEGVYSNKENLQTNLNSLNNKIIDKNDNKYYVYVGITKDLEVAKKIMKIYEDDGYNIYLKEKYLSNEEFYNNVTQFDLLIKDSNDTSNILTIEEVVLANYEEIFKKK